MLQQASSYINRYSHSKRALYKAIIEALPPLKINGNYDLDAIKLAITAGQIMDQLAEASRTWNISIHWLYTVCNPKITTPNNFKYSPVYVNNATDLPLNRFGELDHIIEKDGEFARMGDKLVGDARFIKNGCGNFGSAWNDNGEVIKRDDNGHPFLDGFVGWIAQHVDSLQELCCKNPKRDRHFRAFMISHTRDDEVNKRDGEIEHKESHVHLVIDMPTRRTRYRMMELMGFNFEDLAVTFRWIKNVGNHKERISSFLGTLQGSMKNYVITKNYVSSLQYLVHQSSKAKQNQKTPYAVNEVNSWLPDDPGKTYSSIAGVFDDEMVADGVYAAIIRNLHSPYNLAHHTLRLVGRNDGDRVFSYHQLSKLRSLGSKMPGKLSFSKRAKKLILDQLLKWIYQGKMEVTDWKNAIHGAFDDGDAASLIADQDFIKKLTAVLDDQRESTISDINADRKMTTVFITAAQGGIGKSYLASRLCQYWEKGRTPYMTAAEDKGKTVDYWQDYQDQGSAVIDEVSPSSIEWSALKDMLDPHKIPRVSSRYHNTSPWNVNLLIMTNVYADGISGYIRDVLHYAPGVTKLGYLEQDLYNKRNWKMKMNDPQAGQVYLSQLSQLLRRLPVNIHMSATHSGKGTKIIVSIVNFRPGGRTLQDYDYVYTSESAHTFNVVINDDLPEQKLDEIVVTVTKMIKKIKTKADEIFKNDPNAILGKNNGFIRCHANFGFYIKDGQPLLLDPNQDEKNSNDKVSVRVNPSVAENVLTRLYYRRYSLWPEINVEETNFAPTENQVAALLRGKTVPLCHLKNKVWTTLTLTKEAKNLVKKGEVLPIITRLSSEREITKNDDLFMIGQSSQIAHVLPNAKEDD